MPNTHVPADGRAMPDPRLRHRMERAVEKLLAALDALDGDPDLEPSLAGGYWAATSDGGDDREMECEDEGAQCDDEGAVEGFAGVPS